MVTRVRTIQAALSVGDLGILLRLEIQIIDLPVVVVEQLGLVVLVHHEVFTLLDYGLEEGLGGGIDLRGFFVHPSLVRAALIIKVILPQ